MSADAAMQYEENVKTNECTKKNNINNNNNNMVPSIN